MGGRPSLRQGLFAPGRLGGGGPAWDPDFNTADFPVMLSMQRMSGRYARHFLENQAWLR